MKKTNKNNENNKPQTVKYIYIYKGKLKKTNTETTREMMNKHNAFFFKKRQKSGKKTYNNNENNRENIENR
jgi:hypothetical protein